MRRTLRYRSMLTASLATCLLLVGCNTTAKPMHQTGTRSAHPSAAAQSGVSPLRAWARLIDGNSRYVNGRSEHPDQSIMRRNEIAKGQHPFAVVLTCSDSRVPPEILFDAGLGDIFVIRVAGNTADAAALGSIEYAVEHLHVPLVVVLGHQRCGAVQAAVDAAKSGDRPGGHLAAILDPIAPAVASAGNKPGDLAENAMQENVSRTVHQLKTCKPILSAAVREQKLSVIGARYDLDSGRVTMVGKTGLRSAIQGTH